MFSNSHIRRYLMPVFIAVAVLAIAIPTCQMIGCTMDMSHGMFWPGSAPSIHGLCDGRWIASAAPAGVMPTGIESLVLAVFAAVFAAFVLFAPNSAMRRVAVVRAEPPPPPLDPRGERSRI